MEYKLQHFAKCQFNPMEKNLVEKYPVLADLSDDIRLLKYIIAAYDPHSPFIPQYRDVRVRKQMAAMFAGFNMTTDNIYVEEIFSLKDNTARDAVLKFLRDFGYPRIWFQVCANEKTFYEYGERLMQPIDEEKTSGEKDLLAAIQIKTKLSADMEALDDRIEKGYRKMFGGDDEIEIPGAVGRTTAESMAGKV
jgi:hypothetical protein